MATTPIIPVHNVSEEEGSRCITLKDWKITATTKPIVNAAEADALHDTLGIPLPEMTFGQNSLELVHIKSGWRYKFDTEAALKCVKNGELGEGDGGVKVGYADAWLKSRTEPNSALPMPKTVATKPYDWTYTTVYTGHLEGTSASFVPADTDNPAHTIPMAELTRPDPILFYAEVPLFEDELHDNGTSQLLVKIRVMPTCIFILSRFFLRVDNVLFRVFESRIYHSLESSPPVVVRENLGLEGPYNDVKRFLPRRHDLTLLTDPNFVVKTLNMFPASISQGKGAETGWRALGKSVEIVTLVESESNLENGIASLQLNDFSSK